MTQTLHEMESVLNMNNKAALLIERSEYGSASRMLIQALTIMKSHIDGIGYIHGHNNKVYESVEQFEVEHRSSVTDQNHDEIVEENISLTTSIVAPQAPQHGPLDEGFREFIYRHPIQTDSEIANQVKNGVYVTLSVIMVFNLGLTYHLIALSSEDNLDLTSLENIDDPCNDRQRHYVRYLKSALRLYELGFQMQLKDCVTLDITYAMAVLNNCASIYATLNRKQQAEKFYQHLLSSLLFMIDKGEADKIHEFDGFLFNASRLILPKNVVATAA